MGKQKKVYNEDGELLTALCPVCGNLAFPYEGSWRVCSVCHWEDDLLQRIEPDEDGGANIMSLNQAREAWKKGERIH